MPKMSIVSSIEDSICPCMNTIPLYDAVPYIVLSFLMRGE